MTVWAVAAMLGLAACATAAGRPDLPAVLTNPTAESRAELARRVSGALHGAPITIADDALTRDSTLIVERARPRAIALVVPRVPGDAGGVHRCRRKSRLNSLAYGESAPLLRSHRSPKLPTSLLKAACRRFAC